MAKLAIVIACAVVATANARTMTDYGSDMAIRAFDVVCWWEGLKAFPTQNIKYLDCQGQAQSTWDQVVAQVNDEPSQQQYFGQFMVQMTMSSIPSAYADKCNSFLNSPTKAAASDESDALNDGNSAGSTYPFQGFAYCLLQTLRDTQGQGAIDAVKNEKTHQLKHWRSTILDRDNEYRGRHGDDKFVMLKYLNDEAQKWAETMASECDMHHSSDDSRKWNGEGTGESIWSAGGKDIAEDSAYGASNSWYSEVKNYPYPDAYTGQPLPGEIGHFTQTVWKETKYVGYGYKYNKDCPGDSKAFIAGRYSPGANLPGAYGKNVPPIMN